MNDAQTAHIPTPFRAGVSKHAKQKAEHSQEQGKHTALLDNMLSETVFQTLFLLADLLHFPSRGTLSL